ncbi:hypothetical protein Dimus_000587, partial [Dionaea muscipula]
VIVDIVMTTDLVVVTNVVIAADLVVITDVLVVADLVVIADVLFDLQKLVASIQKNDASNWLQSFGRCLSDRSFYAAGISSDLLITPCDTLLVSCEAYGDTKITRKKAVLRHQFENHNLSVEAVWPSLFIDKHGTYWDVPLSMAIDLASVASDSGPSYHLCMQHTSGSAKQFGNNDTKDVPPVTLLPGLSLRSAFSFKKNVDIWRSSKGKKLKMVQPFDIILSNPHVSASGIIGAVATSYVGDNSVCSQTEEEIRSSFKHLNLRVCSYGRRKSCLLADTFATVSLTAQHGNFQKPFLDLTRFHARLDFTSGSKFISAAAHLAQDVYNSREPMVEAVEAVLPQASFAFQQQIAGPFSFRVDSAVGVSLEKQQWQVRLEDPVFAVEYALQVLGSAKAVACRFIIETGVPVLWRLKRQISLCMAHLPLEGPILGECIFCDEEIEYSGITGWSEVVVSERDSIYGLGWDRS